MVTELRTPRLILRRWREDDRPPWAAMCADPEVMEYYPAVLDRSESDAQFDRFRTLLEDRGWGLWAVEVVGGAPFVGYVGLLTVPDDLPCAPAVEVGWRLARAQWGHGYATEAARAAMVHAREVLALGELVSFTAAGNRRSRAVMERLGMTRDPAEDFDHPRLPPGHPLRHHVLYRITSLSSHELGQSASRAPVNSRPGPR